MSREERGGEEGSVLMGGCMSHTLPPQGVREGSGAALTLPHSCQPPPARGVGDGDCDSSSRHHAQHQYTPIS